MLQFTFIILQVLLAGSALGFGYKRICYFPNWAQYRPRDGHQEVKDIDPNLCTHIMFAFAGLNNSQLQKMEWNDDTTYKELVALKAQNPDLKVMLSVGGASASLTEMSRMLRTQTSRQTFITDSINVLRQYGFDGIDLDFEYPGKKPSVKEDKERFGLLLEEMRQAYEADAITDQHERLLLSVVVPTTKTDIDKGYDVESLKRNADFINMLTYDYHGSWDTQTAHNSPLYEPDPHGPFGTVTNMNYGALYWVGLGVPREMLIVGMAAYGRGFTLTNPKQTGFGSSVTGPSSAQPYTKLPGFIAYFEVCDLISQGAKVVRSEEQQVPYLYRDTFWAGYDDVISLRNKVCWLKAVGFGGYLVWDISMDDIRGTFCGKGPYPLLTALSDELHSNCSGPLPPPSYLLEYKCGPCVKKTDGYDCDQYDPARYHQCQDGLIVFTLKCQSEFPVYSYVDKGCVTNSTLQLQEPCSSFVKCDQSPEAEILKGIGYTAPPTTSTDKPAQTTSQPGDGEPGEPVSDSARPSVYKSILAIVIIFSLSWTFKMY